MKKHLIVVSFVCLTFLLQAFALPTQGPELPNLLLRKWVIKEIDPTRMPTWKDLSEQAKNANNNINRKMIERGSYFDFSTKEKVNVLVYNPFYTAEVLEVPTTYTYDPKENTLAFAPAEKQDGNGDTFRVPAITYKIEQLTKKQLVLVATANNYRLVFKPSN